MKTTTSRRLVAVTAAALLAAPAVFVAAAPAAQAANKTPGCVTKAEYKKAKKGMTKAKVKKIFGTGGKQLSTASAGGFRAEVRNYKTCVEFGSVAITFGNGKLDVKAGVFI
jgi:hypothetical protein